MSQLQSHELWKNFYFADENKIKEISTPRLQVDKTLWKKSRNKSSLQSVWELATSWRTNYTSTTYRKRDKDTRDLKKFIWKFEAWCYIGLFSLFQSQGNAKVSLSKDESTTKELKIRTPLNTDFYVCLSLHRYMLHFSSCFYANKTIK